MPTPKSFLKKRVLPIVMVLGGIYLIYLIWWALWGHSKVGAYSEKKASAYKYREYKIYDRMFFDEINTKDNFQIHQIVPFYFSANGFKPALRILEEVDIQYILKNVSVSSPDESIVVFLNNMKVEPQKVKQRSGPKLRYFVELLEEVSGLGTGSISWSGKKTDGYALVIDYSVSVDSIPLINPVPVFLNLPGLTSFAEKDTLLPVFHPVLSKYEVMDGSQIYLGHNMIHPSKGKRTLWSWLKYVIFIGAFSFFVLLLLTAPLLKRKENDRDEIRTRSKNKKSKKQDWIDHYEVMATGTLREENYKEALLIAENAFKNNYLSPGIYEAAISAAINLRDYSKASILTTRAHKKYPKNPALFLLTGRLAMEQGNYLKAKEYFDTAIELDTENMFATSTWFSAALCSAGLGLKRETLKYIKEIPAKSYEDPHILKSLADVYSLLKMPAEAIEVIHKWMDLEPENEEAPVMLKQCESKLSAKKNTKAKSRKTEPMNKALNELQKLSDINEIIMQAKQLKDNDKYQEVINLLSPLIGKYLNEPTILVLYLAESYNNQKEYSQAINILQKTLKNDSENISLLQELAFAQFQSDEPELAIKTTQKILQLQPHNIIARRVSADAFTDTGDFEKAYPILLELKRLDKLTDLNKFNLSECYIGIEKYEEAIECLKELMHDSGDLDIGWNNIAFCYKKLYLLGDCIDAADKALQLDPDYLNPMFHRAEALYELGVFEEAFEWMEKAAKSGHSEAEETLAAWKANLKH